MSILNLCCRSSRLLARCQIYYYGKCFLSSIERDWVLDDVVEHLQRAETRNVVIMTGAGISTPSGIADFRTPGTGLYDNLEKYNLPYAEAIFDIGYFMNNPKPFLTLAKDLYPGEGKYEPNIIHHFCRLFHDKGKLLRMYTQNIDGLERLAQIPVNKLVEAHGTFWTASCTVCRQSHDGKDIREQIFADKIPKCKNQNCQALVKPDIVFFGEQLPDSFLRHRDDLPSADLLIVMGSSLQVQPFASISTMVDEDTPRVLINLQPVSSFVCSDRPKDILLLGDLVDNVKHFAIKLGWDKELEKLVNKNKS